MDNASFHHSDRIDQMCFDAGVKLVYLPPYLPHLNPIEEFFAELKAFVMRQWHEDEDHPNQDFGLFLEWCISIVGSRDRSAEAHFRHAGITVEAFWAINRAQKWSCRGPNFARVFPRRCLLSRLALTKMISVYSSRSVQ
jgi:hypothetical protein